MAGADKVGLMDVTINIERLVLDGISITYQEQPLLQASIETELGRLIRDGGFGRGLNADCAMDSLSAGDIDLVDEKNHIDLGVQIARAVYSGLYQ